MTTDGWSGALHTRLVDAATGRRYVLKRTSLARDWIARWTADTELRESRFAALVGTDETAPYMGAALDGEGVALLMPDLSDVLLPWDRPIDLATLEVILRAVAALHADDGRAPRAVRAAPACPLDLRLTLLSEVTARGYSAQGNPVGATFLRGWDTFRRHASAPAVALIDELTTNLAPLTAALGLLPAVPLHGDLKLSNVAVTTDGRVAFIDWQMLLVAPVAVDLGWFLVGNAAVLPVAPDVVLAHYRAAARTWAADVDPDRWEAQVDLAMIAGLLLRGWRKALDAEADVVYASGTAAVDDLVWWCDSAVGAAYRRL